MYGYICSSPQELWKQILWLYSVLNCTVHVSVCRRFGLSTFWSVDVLVCRRFGLVWFVDVLVCRRFGLLMFGRSTFWFVDALVCRRFGLSTFRFVDVSLCRRFACRRVGLLTFWPVNYKRVHFNTSKPGYKYCHHFADDISKWISSMAFFIISLSVSFTS